LGFSKFCEYWGYTQYTPLGDGLLFGFTSLHGFWVGKLGKSPDYFAEKTKSLAGSNFQFMGLVADNQIPAGKFQLHFKPKATNKSARTEGAEAW